MQDEPIRIRKRESPQDYIDGYRAALNVVKEYVKQQLDNLDNVQKAHDSIGDN